LAPLSSELAMMRSRVAPYVKPGVSVEGNSTACRRCGSSTTSRQPGISDRREIRSREDVVRPLKRSVAITIEPNHPVPCR
jgi:hypothetical protein